MRLMPCLSAAWAAGFGVACALASGSGLASGTGFASAAPPSPAATPSAPSPAGSPDVARAEAFARFTAGRDALTAERWTDAEKEFRAAIALAPDLALAHY